ncbi:MAG: hypothetical protein KF778_17275 [Rhodocyclaceae bacterium]|nr:hypothetical protein [Rhodocyclaceae bacterium]MBX3670155.1 hypothetical protein [Rhodocyclaceae bacterium]
MNKSLLALPAAALLAFACSTLQPPAKMTDGALTGAGGMSLYTFDKDTAGSNKSVCNGKCAENWPPFYASEMDKTNGDYGVVTRDDGKKQWAYKGKPLYYWSKDQKPGDRTGDGFLNMWKLAR